MSTRGDHKYLKAYANPAQLNKVTVLLSIPAFTNHTDLAAMLNVEHAAIHNLSSAEFQFTVKNVNRLEPAELNIDLFEKVYGSDTIKTEKAFKDKVKSDLQNL